MTNSVERWQRVVSQLMRRRGRDLRLPPPEPGEVGERMRNLVYEVLQNSLTNLIHYKPLVASIENGNWKDAKLFINKYSQALTTTITKQGETALHVAVKTNKSNDVIMNLIRRMSSDALLITDKDGQTALSLAVQNDNFEAVELLIAKQPELPYVRCNKGNSPLQIAAQKGNKGIVSYLLLVTKDHTGYSLYGEEDGQLLLKTLLDKKLYGAVAEVLHRHPILINKKNIGSILPLKFIAKQPSVFLSKCSLSLLQRLLYFCVPTEQIPIFQSHEVVTGYQTNGLKDTEDGNSFTMKVQRVSLDLYIKFWIAIGRKVPYVMYIQEKKFMHQEADKLVEWTCMQLTRVHYENVKEIFMDSLQSAVKFGIEEIVRHILDFFPVLIDDGGIEILKCAVSKHGTYIIKLKNHLSHFKKIATDYKDGEGNNILHLAGAFEKRNIRNHKAVSQMLYELQWFKEMEKLAPPSYRVMKNNNKKTPEMIFVEAHAELLSEGERWIKETGTCCVVVSAITGSFSFAAAVFLTVDSITNDSYITKKKAFKVICFAESLSLVSSSISLFMFVVILMSRYTYRDFHRALPQRLTMGIASLNLSIFSMIVALVAISYGTFKIIVMAVGVAYLVFVCNKLPDAMDFLWPLLSS